LLSSPTGSPRRRACGRALAVVGGNAVVLGLGNVADMAEYTINVCSLIGLLASPSTIALQ
jgi:hypothetical protein